MRRGGISSSGREPEGAGPSPLKLCPTAICVRQKIDSFLPNESIFLSLSMFKSISLSLPVYFCLFFFLSFFNCFFLYTFFLFPTHFFLFFCLFCHLFCVRHYLLSDARAFPGRPGRPARYALVSTSMHEDASLAAGPCSL